MEQVFQLSPMEECALAQGEASLHLELSLEPSLDDSYCPSLTLTTSLSEAPPSSPEQLPYSHTPLPFDTFLQQLRRTAFKRRQGVNLKMRIARKRRTCTICQEMVVEKSVVHDLHCRHTFHRHCLHQWARKHDSCPLCRQQLR